MTDQEAPKYSGIGQWHFGLVISAWFESWPETTLDLLMPGSREASISLRPPAVCHVTFPLDIDLGHMIWCLSLLGGPMVMPRCRLQRLPDSLLAGGLGSWVLCLMVRAGHRLLDQVAPV